MEYTQYYISYNDELYHHGIKGQKWGVRRFQTKSGRLTNAGKKRYSEGEGGDKSERNKKIAKRVAVATVMTATVATAAVLYAKNPKAVNDVVAKMRDTTISGLKKSGNAIKNGKQYMDSTLKGAKAGLKEGMRENLADVSAKAQGYAKVAAKQAHAGIKEGVKEGLKEAPKKAVKAVITGAAMMTTKRLLDKSVGKEEAARIFQANNNKKISSFWKVSPEDKDDDD